MLIIYWGTVADNGRPQSDDTAEFLLFGDEEAWIGVDGLYGCTSLKVVPEQGVYVTHWWEDLSFSSDQAFEARTLSALREGTEFHPSLEEHASQLKDAVAFLMTPRENNTVELVYPEQMDVIKTNVKELLPDVRFETWGSYEPMKKAEFGSQSALAGFKGSGMVHYKPATFGTRRPTYQVFIENESVELRWPVRYGLS
jgi:hypothetical protein